jgi:hypothetical protein
MCPVSRFKLKHIQGTSIFMARAVRTPIIQRGEHRFYPMPQLFDGAARYEEWLAARVQKFPPNGGVTIDLDDKRPLNPFRHRLHHDAESVFWLLVWWCIHAKPEFNNDKNDLITSSHWGNLTGGSDSDDPRIYFIGGQAFPPVCHAEYQPLETLLELMSKQLRAAPELLPDRDQDEYLHEVFQRLIFDFLCKHLRANSPFLILKKSLDRRKLSAESERMEQPKPTHRRTNSHATGSHVSSSSKRSRKDEDDEEYRDTSHKGKKVSQSVIQNSQY